LIDSVKLALAERGDLMDDKICHNCKFHCFERDPEIGDTSGIIFDGTFEEKRKFLQEIWHNQYCSNHNTLTIVKDPLTGKMGSKFPHCREINRNCDCSFFEAKP